MTKTTFRLSLILSAFMLFLACKKELSLEKGGFGGTAQGQLVDSLGNCKTPVINGTYSVDTPLITTKHFVLAKVNFTAAGKYKIYTDTVNGMWFQDSGFVVSAGVVEIKLKGYGTPILPKTTDFALLFNNNICGFSVSVSGSATGGGGTGGGGGGTNTDYFPTTTGSSWVYQYIPKLGAIDTFTVRVADVAPFARDTLSYFSFGTRLQDTFYFAKDGKGTYYALSTVDFDYTFLFDSIPSSFISYPFLKENANVGESWSTADYGKVKANGQIGMAKAVFTIISKNTQPYTIGIGAGNKTYQNVINVQREILFMPDGGTSYTTLLKGNSYYAKGFGLIDQVFPAISQSVSLFTTPTIK